MTKEVPKQLLKLIFTVHHFYIETKFTSGQSGPLWHPPNLGLTEVNYMILSEYARRFVPGRKIVLLSTTCHRKSLYFTSSVLAISLLSVTSKLCVSRLNMLSIDPAWVPLHACTSFLCSKSIEPVCLPLGWSWIWGLGRVSFCPYGLLIRLHSWTSQQSCRSSEAGRNFIFTWNRVSFLLFLFPFLSVFASHLPRVWVRLKRSVGDCGDNLVAAKGRVRWICRGNPFPLAPHPFPVLSFWRKSSGIKPCFKPLSYRPTRPTFIRRHYFEGNSRLKNLHRFQKPLHNERREAK